MFLNIKSLIKSFGNSIIFETEYKKYKMCGTNVSFTRRILLTNNKTG
jgi:hypothetical protein